MSKIEKIKGTSENSFSVGIGTSEVTIRTNGGILEGKNNLTSFSKILLSGNNLSDLDNKNTSLNNILPSQTGNNGKVLYTDGTNTSWQKPENIPTKTATFVRRNTNQTIAGSNTLVKVQFNSTLKDSQTEWDGTNFRWISEKSQDVVVTVNGILTGMNNARRFNVFIYLNGNLIVGNAGTNANTGSSATQSSASHILSVSANDYIEMYVSTSHNNNCTLTSAFLSIKEI